MHTLMTQVRLKRLIRLHEDLAERLLVPGTDERLPAAAVRKLVKAVQDVRDAWQSELGAAGGDLGHLRRHVSRSLAALAANCARLEQPGADPVALDQEFREASVALLIFLRGLEGLDVGTLAPLLVTANGSLTRSA